MTDNKSERAMTKDQVVDLCIWQKDKPCLGKLICYSPIFEREVEIQILVENDKTISDKSVEIINEFLNLDVTELATMKRFLWNSFKECCENISYGFEIEEGQNETEANYEAFKVFNEEEAYRKSTLLHLTIDEEEDETLKGNYGLIAFDNEWEGHLCVMVMKNGKIIDYGEDGLFIGIYEDEEL